MPEPREPELKWYEEDGVEVAIKFQIRGVKLEVTGFEAKQISREQILEFERLGFEIYRVFYQPEKLAPVATVSLESSEDAIARPVVLPESSESKPQKQDYEQPVNKPLTK